MNETEVFGWKVTKFIKNTNYDFVRKQILSVCGEDKVDDALNLISNWENYNSTPLLELNKLSKKTTSLNILIATPDLFFGAGGVGIFKGAGIVAYS